MSAATTGIAAGGTSASQMPGKPKTLGQDEFLKLLTTQLKAQDPMKPVEDTQFIAQMAQFSSLEQMQLMNQNFSKFNDAQAQSLQMQTLASAANMIGKIVYAGSGVDRVLGTVSEVRQKDGKLSVVMHGVDAQGKAFDQKEFGFDQISQVGSTTDEVTQFQQLAESAAALTK